MPRIYPIRTVLGLHIRQRRLSFDEFAEQLEVFARENKEVGTLSVRHIQRLAAGKLSSDQLRPATVRLLEKFLESRIEDLLSAPQAVTSTDERVSRESRRVSVLAVMRKRLGYSQEGLAEKVGVDTATVGCWERGVQEPQPWMRPKIAKALGVAVEELAVLIEQSSGIIEAVPAISPVTGTSLGLVKPTEVESGDAVNRRTLLSVAAVAAASVTLARELTASISGGDAGPLAHMQTTYEVDRAIASGVDNGTRRILRRWAIDLANPVARVNATGILAKVPGQSESQRVVTILQNDEDVRRLYLTAVTTRVCSLDWGRAATLVENPSSFPSVSFAAERFAREVMNPADSGARWCSAAMLQKLSPAIGR